MANLNINLPFSFNNNYNLVATSATPTGPVTSTTDLKVIYQNRIFAVLFTKFGERVMRPNFGSDLHKIVFETQEVALEIAERTISTAFSKWLPDLQLEKIEPLFDGTTGYFTFIINYRLPSGEVDGVKINTALFNRFGEILRTFTNG